ncbi:hypothetical protein [Bacillus sp. FJAT-27251]|uniref:hypothetical protein n=1 Tax=Bacillus sp. FJAT-27251 TaxID=1684142 RepID=UPI0006A7C46A|nr:hypothetical protein [Bacillus sp. FJAT-27251]
MIEQGTARTTKFWRFFQKEGRPLIGRAKAKNAQVIIPVRTTYFYWNERSVKLDNFLKLSFLLQQP